MRRSLSNRNEKDGIADAEEDDVEIAEFAMKIMHKPSLKSQRAIRYDTLGQMQMINNYDKKIIMIQFLVLKDLNLLLKKEVIPLLDLMQEAKNQKTKKKSN